MPSKIETELSVRISAVTIKDIFKQDAAVLTADDETVSQDDQISPVLKSMPAESTATDETNEVTSGMDGLDINVATPPRAISNMTGRQQLNRSALSRSDTVDITAETGENLSPPVSTGETQPKHSLKKRPSLYKMIKRKLLKKQQKPQSPSLEYKLIEDAELQQHIYLTSHNKLAVNRALVQQVLISNLIVELLKSKNKNDTSPETDEKLQKERERIIKKRDRMARKSSSKRRHRLMLLQTTATSSRKQTHGSKADDSWKLLWIDRRARNENDDEDDTDDFIIEERRHKTQRNNSIASQDETEEDETPLALLAMSTTK